MEKNNGRDGRTSSRGAGSGNRSTSGRGAGSGGTVGRASGRTGRDSGGYASQASGSKSGSYSSGRGTGKTGSRYAKGDKSAASSRKAGRKRCRRKRHLFPILLALLVILMAGCAIGAYFLLEHGSLTFPYGGMKLEGGVPSVTVDLSSLDSPHVVLYDAETGTVIGAKGSGERIFPASMVKIMTVFTAIEQISDLDQTVTMSYDYYQELYDQDASRAGFDPGEEAVVRDLLYGALLPSGAECCRQLALEAAGSESDFVGLMNEKAQSLGLEETHFANATGLHDDSQYSTVEEIGQILMAALKNKTFYQVFTTESYTVQPTNLHPEGFTFQSSMFKGMQSPTVIGGEILGGKTGYTDEAGRCLASLARIEGRYYVLVTAGWAANPRVEQYHINDAFLGYNALGRALAE